MVKGKRVPKMKTDVEVVLDASAETDTAEAPTEAAPLKLTVAGKAPTPLSNFRPGDLFAIGDTYYRFVAEQVYGINVTLVRLENNALVDVEQLTMGYNTLVKSVLI